MSKIEINVLPYKQWQKKKTARCLRMEKLPDDLSFPIKKRKKKRKKIKIEQKQMESSAQWKQLLSRSWEHAVKFSFAVSELQAITNETALLRAFKRTIKVRNKLPSQSQRAQLEAGSASSFLSSSPKKERNLEIQNILTTTVTVPSFCPPYFCPFCL